MKKVVIASDKYKSCLTSMEVATAIKEGILSVFPHCEVIKIPVADGGDGTLQTLVEGTRGIYKTVKVMNPLMQPIEAQYGVLGDGKTVVIELAAASGLALVPESSRNPMLTTTYGTGQLILDALQAGYTDFIIGIGGSATNDAGTGLLQALGCRFLDETGNELAQGGQILKNIAKIDFSGCTPLLNNARFRIASDVQNPFFGRQGAAYVYAPQKGATPDMVRELDNGLQHFALLIQRTKGLDINRIPGAGAAGGVGGAMVAFLNASIEPGVDLILDYLDFDKQIVNADWIITGEGKMDAQTAQGKVPKGVADRAQKQQIPVVAFAGSIEDYEIINKMGIASAFSITPSPLSLEEAMNPETARQNLYQTVKQVFSLVSQFPFE